MAVGFYGDSFSGAQSAALADEQRRQQRELSYAQMLQQGVGSAASRALQFFGLLEGVRRDKANEDLNRQYLAQKEQTAAPYQVQAQIKLATDAARNGEFDSVEHVGKTYPLVPSDIRQSLVEISAQARPQISQEYELAENTAKTLTHRAMLQRDMQREQAAQALYEKNRTFHFPLTANPEKEANEASKKYVEDLQQRLLLLPPAPSDKRLLNMVIQDPTTGAYHVSVPHPGSWYKAKPPLSRPLQTATPGEIPTVMSTPQATGEIPTRDLAWKVGRDDVPHQQRDLMWKVGRDDVPMQRILLESPVEPVQTADDYLLNQARQYRTEPTPPTLPVAPAAGPTIGRGGVPGREPVAPAPPAGPRSSRAIWMYDKYGNLGLVNAENIEAAIARGGQVYQ